MGKSQYKGKKYEKMKKNYEKLVWKMSFWLLVFGKCPSGFICFAKKYYWEMFIQRHTFEVSTVNLILSSNS